jgi:hypothetical protein
LIDISSNEALNSINVHASGRPRKPLKEKIAMPRTAPTFDDTPNYRILSLRMIDISGDKRAEGFEISPTASAANIEAFVAGYALRTNANIYAMWDSQVYNVPASASDANAGAKSDSVADGINFLYVSNTNDSEDVRLIAPIASLMVGDTDTVDPTEGVAFNALVEPLLTGTKVGVTAQYTERKEKKNNPKTSF